MKGLQVKHVDIRDHPALGHQATSLYKFEVQHDYMRVKGCDTHIKIHLGPYDGGRRTLDTGLSVKMTRTVFHVPPILGARLRSFCDRTR